MRGSRGDDLPSRLRRHAHAACGTPTDAMREAADEIDRLTAEVDRMRMECRQWRQAVDMATRRAVAAEALLGMLAPAPAHPQPWVSPFRVTHESGMSQDELLARWESGTPADVRRTPPEEET